MPRTKSFSDQLEDWLKSDQPKTFAGIDKVFGDKSFAIMFLLLMILPALPLPTGGITHIFEIITMLLALELIVGRKTFWLPKRWRNLKLGDTLQGKFLPAMMSRIRWFEKYSAPRATWLFKLPFATNLAGLVVFSLALAAFLSPPFSGLDTLPSLGVVIISLALILEDAAFLAAGLFIGAGGVVLSIGLGEVIVKSVHHLF